MSKIYGKHGSIGPSDLRIKYPDTIFDLLPNLRNAKYRVTSPYNESYNCFAFAADDLNHRWDPYDRRFFWPSGFPRDGKLATLIAIYRKCGFTECGDGSPERGTDKLAIFVDKDGEILHAAIQKHKWQGQWRSKLGYDADIEHILEDVNLQGYGKLVQFMRRPKSLFRKLAILLRRGFPVTT